MIEHSRLVALALGELAQQDAASVEDHVLACSACAATLERLLLARDVMPDLIRAGQVRIVLTARLLEQLEREGLVTRTYRLDPGEKVACSVRASDIYTVVHLRGADLSTVARLDAAFEIPGNAHRLADIPFDRERGLVLVAQRADYIRTLPGGLRTIRLIAVENGTEREIATYLLDHTAFAG
jgi:hypothetical protein